MAVPANVEELLDLVRKSGVADEKRLDAFLKQKRAGLPADIKTVADLLIQNGVLTNFQAENILQGKWKRFTIGKYKILERLGSGGFAQVYLCEHMLMRRRVAVKVLPVAKTKGSSALERFYREARALEKLDHPNIVHFYDLDQDGDLHFIVLEYVDGNNLQEIVKISGALSVERACNYVAQASLALEHASENGMVHRDIKPGNILVDRAGVVKLLDLGLALRHEGENSQLTKIHDDGTLGTADYISPEQVMDSHDVDIRTDIYSLGATFYFLLTGRPPFDGLQVADKLMAHQKKQPRPITDFRGDVPAGVVAIVSKMMAKSADQRYAAPADVADALEPFNQNEVAPPPAREMPVLSPAATVGGAEAVSPGSAGAAPRIAKPTSGLGQAKPIAAPLAVPIQAKAEAEVGEQSTPWESFAADTHNGAEPADAQGSSRSAVKNKKPLKSPRKMSLVTIVLILGFVVVPICLTAGIFLPLWWYYPTGVDKPPDNKARKLEVTKDPGRKNAFRSIQAALRNAEIDSVIELLDDVYEENVVFDGSKGGRTSITLQAAPGKKEIVWRSGGKDPDTPLLRIIRAPDFKLKGAGITLDGALDKDRSLNDLITITSDCSGLRIEDLQMRYFTRNAILVMNAAGSQDRPIRIERLWTFTQKFEKPRAAIYFDANPKVTPSLNEHIEIGDCKFHGLEPEQAIQFNKKLTVFGENVRWPGR